MRMFAHPWVCCGQARITSHPRDGHSTSLFWMPPSGPLPLPTRLPLCAFWRIANQATATSVPSRQGIPSCSSCFPPPDRCRPNQCRTGLVCLSTKAIVDGDIEVGMYSLKNQFVNSSDIVFWHLASSKWSAWIQNLIR
jgi:hypothetical protein